MRPALVLATFVAALALVAAGCGGSDASSASPTEEWADGFCTAITSWTDSLSQVGDRFSNPASFTKEALDDSANEIRTATETLVDDLRSLGAPDTESGQAAKESLDELAITLESDLAEIESAVEGASGLTELPAAITAITTAFASMGTAFSSTLQTIESGDAKGELQSALEQAPACSEIAGSSGS